MHENPMHIFSGGRHQQLAIEIAGLLKTNLGNSTTTFLPDSEIHVILNEVVRGHDIYFIQPIARPVNDAIMELLLYIDAFRRASANKINVMLPYFPYARQERMARGRESISARVIADLIESQGADRISFIDIHNPAIQGFFKIPVDPISALGVFCNYLENYDLQNSIIVSPDVGRTPLAAKYAEKLGLPMTVLHKRRDSFSATRTTHMVGEICGKRPIIIDDMIAGGSILNQIDFLFENGVDQPVWLAITHPILLPNAISRISADDRIEKVIVTNTLPLPEPAKECSKIEQISIAPLLAEIIWRIYIGESISSHIILS